MKPKRLLIISIAILTSACTISEFGNPKGAVGGDSNLDEGCTVVSEEPIGWTEKSAIGLSPQEVLGEVAGNCQAPFRWDATGWNDALRVDPERGETTVEVTIEVDQESAVFITREPDDSTNGIDSPCDPVFEVLAEVSLKTEDGAFNENQSVTVTYRKDYPIPIIDFTEHAKHLEGTLSIEASENWDASLFFQIMPIQKECAGRVGLSAERKVSDKESEGVGQIEFARWSTSNCEFGTLPVDLAEPYGEVVLKDEIEMLWGDAIYHGVWDDERSTEYHFEVDLASDTGCLEEMESRSVVSVPISITSSSSDGRIIHMTGEGLLHATFENDFVLTQLQFSTSEEIACEESFDLSYASIDCSDVDFVTAQLILNQYYRYEGTNGGSVELYVHNLEELSDAAPGAADSVPRLQLTAR